MFGHQNFGYKFEIFINVPIPSRTMFGQQICGIFKKLWILFEIFDNIPIPSKTMFGQQIRHNPGWLRARWRWGRWVRRGTWWWWSRSRSHLWKRRRNFDKGIFFSLCFKNFYKGIFFSLCIKIFLEGSLTSEEIETNGGWGMVNEQTMLVKSKSHFQKLTVLCYFQNYDFALLLSLNNF